MRLDTDTMTATERVLTAVNREEPDRVPIFLMGMPIYSDFYQEFLRRQEDPTLGFEAFTENDENVKITPFGDLTVPYFFGHEVAQRGIDIEGQFTRRVDAEGNFIEDAPQGEPESRQVTYFGRLEGVKVLPNGENYTWYIKGFLDNKEKLLNWFDTYGWPHEHKISSLDVHLFQEMQEKFGRDFCVMAHVGNAGFYERTWFMMGQARFVYYTRKDPELVMRVINSIKDASLNMVDELKPVKPNLIWVADDLGQKGRALLSPAMHEKFFGEARREFYAKVHEELGAKIIMHSCGNVEELLPQLADWGLDGWQSLEPASEIDHAAVKAKFGDRMCFWGGIDSSRELCFGNAESIRKHVQKQIAALGRGGGYVAGPAHDYLNVPVDNAIAMRDAILELGKYPLQF
ncbi:MAG TPA: uroporphyrinogen decarboxylase family protein [Candidatus Lokiarchaeia archaeon]|nr:uroporphyrinogen decarboxylase family protein [Candidatus Lokiarchaeia archaeon]